MEGCVYVSTHPPPLSPQGSFPLPKALSGPRLSPSPLTHPFTPPKKTPQLILSNLVPPATTLPRYAAYFTVPSPVWAAVVALVGGVFAFLARREWGRKLLLRSVVGVRLLVPVVLRLIFGSTDTHRDRHGSVVGVSGLARD